MKGDPRFQSTIDIDVKSGRFMAFFNELRAQFERDRMDRMGWVEKTKRYHARRMAVDKRKPSFPFPGSADVWPPLVDMITEQMKSLYLNIMLLSTPPVSAQAFSEEDEYRVPDIETFMEYQINYGSPYFMREQHFYVDDILSEGCGRLKTYWEYSTRSAPQTITLRTIPDEISRRVVREDVPPGMDILFLTERMFGQLEDHPQIIGGRLEPSTRTLLETTFDLDRDDPTDAKSLDRILGWLRTGARQPLTFLKRNRIIDAPACVSIMGENFVTPSYANDIEDCFHVSHEMWYTRFQAQQKWRDMGWYDDSAKSLLEGGAGKNDPRVMTNGIRSVEAQRQGMHYTIADKFYVVESCSYYDYDEDQVPEKVVVLWSPSCEGPLKVWPYESPGQRWPYHLTPFERNKRGIWGSRGIGERLQDIEREVVVSTRAELNRQMISSSLSLLVRTGSPADNQAIRWVPGEKIRVADVNTDIKPLVIPDLSIIFQNRQEIWKVWSESYTGTPNYAINDPTRAGNEPRTAREITAIQSQGRAIGITRTSLYREAMSNVFQEMFNLWQTYGPEKVWVPVTGSRPIELSQDDLQGAYHFILGPLVGMEDPSVESQKSLLRIQQLMTIAQSGLLPPEMMVDFGAAVEGWLRKDDPRMAKKVLKRRSPEEMQQAAMQQQQRSQMAGVILGSQAAQGSAKTSDLMPPIPQGPQLQGM